MDGDPLAELLARYRERGDLLALLKEVQTRFGGLGPDLLAAIAKALDLRVGDLYGTVSFYSFLARAPVGRHTLRLCQSVPCRLGQGDALRAAVERELQLKPGATTPDGRFTLQLTSCLGACGQAPAMLVDEQRFAGLGDAEVAAVLAEFD